MSAPPAPPRVANFEEYWAKPPPLPSPRLTYWLARFNAGWRPNRRISQMGYYEAAEWYGVWIWEYVKIIRPWESGWVSHAAKAALAATPPAPQAPR